VSRSADSSRRPRPTSRMPTPSKSWESPRCHSRKTRIVKNRETASAEKCLPRSLHLLSSILHLRSLLVPRPPPPRLAQHLAQLLQFARTRAARLEQAGDELIDRSIEDLVEEAGRLLLAAVGGRIDERPPAGCVPDEPLLVHDAEQRLNGVERQFPV